jgi:transcriptional regulator with XRE-family HTH domain
MDIRRILGENVRRHRMAAGLSQEELAARIGVDQGYVSKLEIGLRNPTVVTIWHVAKALSVEPNALLASASPRLGGTKLRRGRSRG